MHTDIIVEKMHDFIFSKMQKMPASLMSIFLIFSIVVLIPGFVLFTMLGVDESINICVFKFFASEYIKMLFSVICGMDAVPEKVYTRTGYRNFFL